MRPRETPQNSNLRHVSQIDPRLQAHHQRLQHLFNPTPATHVVRLDKAGYRTLVNELGSVKLEMAIPRTFESYAEAETIAREQADNARVRACPREL